MSGEMRREYEAGRVSVDTCNHIGWTTQWVWVSVGLGRRAELTAQFVLILFPVVGTLLLSSLIMLTKRRLTRGSPRRLATVSGEDNDRDRLTVIFTG